MLWSKHSVVIAGGVLPVCAHKTVCPPLFNLFSGLLGGKSQPNDFRPSTKGLFYGLFMFVVSYIRRDFGEESELGWNDIWYRVLPVETQKKDKGNQRYQLCLTAVLMMLVSLPLLMMLKFISHISTLFWVLLGIRLVSVYRSSLSVSATWNCHHVFIILNDLVKGFQP